MEARYLGQHARTGAMIDMTADGIVCGILGRRLPEAERWEETGWQDLKREPWDLRPTSVPAPEVDVEAQRGAAEAERRERRWQNKAQRESDADKAESRRSASPRKSAREKSLIRRISTSISVTGGRDGATKKAREFHVKKK